MAFLCRSTVLALFCLVLQAHNAFSEESNKEQINHIAHALYRYEKACVEEVAANAKMEESKLIRDANKDIVDFRKYIFSDYGVKNKKVDECVNKALSIIEESEFSPTDCRQPMLYIKVHDEILDQFTEEKIANKANELCGNLEKEKSSKVVECAQKAFKEIEKKNDKKQTKQKFDELLKRTKTCLNKLKRNYETAKKEVKKCR